MWEHGQFVVGAWSGLTDPFAATIMGNAGFDVVCVDLQHSHVDLHLLADSLGAVSRAGSIAAARVPWNAPDPIMRALDLGAQLVIVPMISTREEAASAVRFFRYAPAGGRSWGPIWRHEDGVPPTPQEGDALATNALMIETKEGLDNVEAIAAVDGVDALYVGPNDLALSLGLDLASRRESREFDDAIRRIIAVGHAAGISVGIDCEGAQDVKYWRQRGADFALCSHDSLLLEAAAKAAAGECKAASQGRDLIGAGELQSVNG